MAKNKNWQLKREIEYPYDEHRPVRQWAIVFDLNKCIACQTCSLACKTTWTSGRGQEYMFWNNVETKPWGGYPLGWDINVLEKLGPQEWSKTGEYKGKTLIEAAPAGERVLHFAPTDEDWMYPNVGEDDCAGASVDGFGHVPSLPHDKWFALHLSRVPRRVSSQRDLQTSGRRNRPDRSVALQGIWRVRPRLPVQEVDVQPGDPHE